MTLEQADGGAVPSIDELRRRVYGPDASAADVARYEAAVASARAVPVPSAAPAATAADEADPPDLDAPAVVQAAPAARHGRRRRRGLLIGAAVLVVALVAVVVGTQRAPDRPQAPVASPAPLGVDGVTRVTFIRALVQGRSAGIGYYLDSHPEGRPAALATATRSETVEHAGDGTRTVRLRPTSQSGGDGGRATVILVLAVDGRAGWAAYRLTIDEHHSVRRQRSAQRGGHQTAGVPTAGTFAFDPGERPVQLRVTAPAGVRWDVTVVFTD